MTLRFQNITIRDAKMSDAGLLTEWWNDGAIMAHAGFPDGLGTNIEKVKRGVGEVILDTMENNLRARHVYELLGFEMLRVNENVWTSPTGTSYSSVDYRLVPESFKDFTK